MDFWGFVPSWYNIEDSITHELGYQGQGNFRTHLNEQVSKIALVLRRLENTKTAFHRAEWEAGRQLRQRFEDIEISSVLTELLGTVTQMAMIIAASVLTSGAIGAGIGTLAGGIGALPGAIAGAAVGVQASALILGALGLASVAEFFIDGLPAIANHYVRGISTVWDGTRGNEGLTPSSEDDPFVIDQAAAHIAQGHVEMVVLLLGAIVAYLTRGRGNIAVLASEMGASAKGGRLAQWMLKHQEALKKRRDLQPLEPRHSSPLLPNPSPDPHRPRDSPSTRKPLGMPPHRVPCFNADKLHYSKIPEFDRQLGGQEKGLNNLTVEEYLQGREAFKAGETIRNPKVAADARKNLTQYFKTKQRKDLFSKGMSFDQAEHIAEKLANDKMSTLAALHNPDLVAGGKDKISDFGDRRVNSSIGAQWRKRIDGLDEAAKRVDLNERATLKINSKLTRCV